MNFFAQTVRRALLWILTTAVPVVLSACYGVMYGFRRAGRVVDGATGKAIPGIKIQCLNDRNEVVGSDTTSDGPFYVKTTEPFTTVVFTDMDGEENGGDFGEVKIPADRLDSDEPVRMTRKR